MVVGWKTRLAGVGALALVAITAACGASVSSSTTSGGSSPGGSARSGAGTIPSAAFSDHTGITADSVHVGNVSTLTVGGLFKGALVGTQAYADYVDSTGGVNGRTIIVDSGDDGSSGAGNRLTTQSAISNDFALVGGFSLHDGFGGTLLASDPGMPDVSVVTDAATNDLPNVFSAVPMDGGWGTGPLIYFKQKYPKAIGAVGTVTADTSSALAAWAGEKYAMGKVGYQVIYDPSVPVTQTDFTPNVMAMQRAGVKLLVIDQLPPVDASALLKDLQQQDFHPRVVLGASTYSDALLADSGGAANVDGDQLYQSTSFYLGQDAATIPAVALFSKWVATASPGFRADLFTLYGWLSAALFSDALRQAGPDPSRGSLLRALSRITTFSGQNIVAPNDPAAKTVGNCYLVGQVANGKYQRLNDPSVSGPTHGYRCDGRYVRPPAA